VYSLDSSGSVPAQQQALAAGAVPGIPTCRTCQQMQYISEYLSTAFITFITILLLVLQCYMLHEILSKFQEFLIEGSTQVEPIKSLSRPPFLYLAMTPGVSRDAYGFEVRAPCLLSNIYQCHI